MATAEHDRPAIIVGTARDAAQARITSQTLAGSAARMMWAAGYIFLLGSVVDILLLWTMQRQPEPAYEFASLAATIEGTPRIALAMALIMGGNYIRGSVSLIAQRLCAIVLLVLGLAGAVIGALVLADYFVVRPQVQPAEQRLFLSTVLKALTLAALHVVILVPVGVLGLRRPRG